MLMQKRPRLERLSTAETGARFGDINARVPLLDLLPCHWILWRLGLHRLALRWRAAIVIHRCSADLVLIDGSVNKLAHVELHLIRRPLALRPLVLAVPRLDHRAFGPLADVALYPVAHVLFARAARSVAGRPPRRRALGFLGRRVFATRARSRGRE